MIVFNPESQDQASNTKVKQIEPLLEGMIGMILANENAFAHDKILLLLQQFSMYEEIKSERIKNRKWIISNFQIFIQFPPGPPAGCSTWGLCSRPWSPREVGAFCSPCYHLWHGFTFLLVPVFILSTVRRDDIYHIWGFKRWYEVSKILFPQQLRRIRPLSVPE